MKTKLIHIVVCALMLLSGQACKKMIEVPPPKNEIILSEAFKNDYSAVASVVGIYEKMQRTKVFENGGITIYSGLSSDELKRFTVNEAEDAFYRNDILPDNTILAAMWQQAYATMAQINTCIEGLSASSTISPAVKQQLLGEAYFSRAFELFYLVNIWGEVPIVTTRDWKTNEKLARSPASEVYSQIISDLKKAKTLLVEKYPSNEKVRPNLYTATALLARTYLYTKDWVNAEKEASLIINTALYTPLPDLTQVFLKTNKEAIWQLVPDNGLQFGYNTEEGNAFIGFTAYGMPSDYTITDELINAFEIGDDRKNKWIGSVTYRSKIYYYPLKYRAGYGTTTLKEYYTVFRVAEQYLIRAEALAQLDRVSDAVKDINVIRKRARGTTPNVPDIESTISKADFLIALAKERRIEFFCEFGHRWLDIKRNGTASDILPAVKPNWRSSSLLFPIPKIEIEKNRNLTQNDGYIK